SGEVTFSRGDIYLPSRFFYFKDSQNILLLDIHGNVYRSYRYNRFDKQVINWERVEVVPYNQATSLIPHPFDNKKAYILTKGTTHYKTKDQGHTWESFSVPYQPSSKENIGKCLWGVSTEDFSGAPADSIFCIDSKSKLIESDDFFSNKKI
ncbi:5535_t:CDS:2, partial [Dentiscutata heterogama]